MATWMPIRRSAWRALATCAMLVDAAEAAEPIAYGEVDATTFEQAVTAFRNDPTYLVNNMPLLRALTPEQLAQAIERLDMNHYSYLYPVVIKGSAVTGLVGQNVDRVSVMVVRGDRMQPVPFQIDEMDEKGWVFLPEVSPNKVQGRYGVIDPGDEIVFMYRDTGYEPYDAARHGAVEGRILKELAFEHEANRAMPILWRGTRAATTPTTFPSMRRPVFPGTATSVSVPTRPISSTSRTFAPTSGRGRTSACWMPSTASWRRACSPPGPSCVSTPWTTSVRS
ncbi:MAG: hypothetical protein AMXMBFR76_08790 [Pseudomonadota bacterium]